jgi:transposase
MQTYLPFFPENTKHINGEVSFCTIGETVHYFLWNKPIYCHEKDDRNGYRFIVASLVKNKRCTIKELSDALGVPRKNIERYAKAYREHGAEHFFNRKETRGQCHKKKKKKITAIQSDLDNGTSTYRTALHYEVSESAISYHIRKGNLKKNS